MRTSFLSREDAKKLTQYKYSGSDASLLYKHFFSPIAQFLVDKVIPPTLAPNVITLTGFACTLIPHLLIWAYAPGTLSGPIPAWLCILAGLGQLFYMILDNADGKQARKTGSSSPLGLLFDHGCDAMNTFISGLTLFTVLQLGNSGWSILGYMITFITFFMATWEEYYIEALNLPIFNGANEGIMGAVLILIFTGIVGTDFWTNTIIGIPMNLFVVFFFLGVSVITIWGNYKTVKEKTQEKFAEALSKLNVLIYIVICMLVVAWFSPSDVLERTARYIIYFAGFSFAKLVGLLQATHCAHAEFEPYRKSILISVTFVILHTLVAAITGFTIIKEDTLIYLAALFAFLAHAHFTWNIIEQFTDVLGIRVFKIGRDEEQPKLRKADSATDEEFDA